MSEKKVALKSARELIDNKCYDEALLKCKEIISSSGPDYMALVFSGVCNFELSRIEEAKENYLEAARLDSKKTVAWQGLYKLYDSGKLTPDEECLECCKNLMALLGDTQKQREYVVAELKCLLHLKKWVEIDAFLNGHTDDEMFYEMIVDFVTIQEGMNENQLNLLRRCVDELLTDEQEKSNILDKILLFELQFGSLSQCRVVAYRLYKLTAEKRYKTIYILPVTFELMSGEKINESNVVDDHWAIKLMDTILMKDWSEALTQLKEQSKCTKLAPDVFYNPDGFIISLLGTLVYLNLHMNSLARDAARKSLKSLKFFCSDQSAVEAGININLATALLDLGEEKDLEEVQSILLSTLECELYVNEANLLLSKVYVSSSRFEDAYRSLSLVTQMDAQYYSCLAWIQLHENKLDQAKLNAIEALQSNDTFAWAHFVLGKILWCQGRRDGSVLKEFHRSARLDPQHSQSFSGMGLYYSQVEQQWNKAARCMQMALSLKYTNDAARQLSDIYLKIGTNARKEHRDLLEQINEDWAQLRLGLELTNDQQTDRALAVLQSLTRSHPDWSRAWECLGDAYQSRGSLESAEKCFEKVLQLEPASLYAALGAANIQLSRENFASAAEICAKVLAIEPEYVPGLALMAEIYLKWAQYHWTEARYLRCLQQIGTSTELALKITQIDAKLVTGWKVLADCLLLLSHFDPGVVAEAELIILKEMGTVTKLSLLDYSINFYTNALKCGPRSGSVCYDLSVSLLYKCRLLESDSVRSKVAQNCKAALQNAINLESTPEKTKCWICLGVLHVLVLHQLPVAQHCFIKALNIDPQCAQAWACLGVLYLGNDNMQLANGCFKMGQSADPNLAVAWCGQAILAARVAHYDAMDLMRHTTLLANLRTALCNYGYLVLNKLQQRAHGHQLSQHDAYDIDTVQALPTARDALEKYCSAWPDDLEALLLLSVLLELEGMNRTAMEYVKRALQLHNIEDGHKNIICANLARIECKLGLQSVTGPADSHSRALYSTSTADWPAAQKHFCQASKEVATERAARSLRLSTDVCAVMSDQTPHQANQLISSLNSCDASIGIVQLLSILRNGKQISFLEIKRALTELIKMEACSEWLEIGLILIATNAQNITEPKLLSVWLMHQFPGVHMVVHLSSILSQQIDFEQHCWPELGLFPPGQRCTKNLIARLLHTYAGHISEQHFEHLMQFCI